MERNIDFIKSFATSAALAEAVRSVEVGSVNKFLKKFLTASNAGSTKADKLNSLNLLAAFSKPNYSAIKAGNLINSRSIASVIPLIIPMIPPSIQANTFVPKSPSVAKNPLKNPTIKSIADKRICVNGLVITFNTVAKGLNNGARNF